MDFVGAYERARWYSQCIDGWDNQDQNANYQLVPWLAGGGFEMSREILE